MVRKNGDPPAHLMGGKEERASQIGKARSEAERQERDGMGPPPTEIPGPSTQELLRGPKAPPSAEDITGPKSEKPRAGPTELEPENKKRADVPDSLGPKGRLPDRSDQ